MANEINAERIQLMIQTALAAQAEVYAKESADRERILLADFEVRLQHTYISVVLKYDIWLFYIVSFDTVLSVFFLYDGCLAGFALPKIAAS